MNGLITKCSVLLVLTFLLASCANNITVKKVGTTSYQPLSPYDSVIVFSTDTQVKGPLEVIALIEFSNIGKYRRLVLADVLEPIKETARKIGANGVIIDKTDTIYSGIASRGISVEARAIRHSAIDKAAVGKPSPKERLMQLKEMLDAKVISPNEYESKRKEILDSL